MASCESSAALSRFDAASWFMVYNLVTSRHAGDSFVAESNRTIEAWELFI
jgi:hypothetical protein